VPPQTYYDAIYKDAHVFKAYHKDINKYDGAEVTPWADGQRTVTFGLALTIPAVVKKVVGELLLLRRRPAPRGPGAPRSRAMAQARMRAGPCADPRAVAPPAAACLPAPGVDEFTVKESQTLKWQDNQSFVVTSLPLLDVSPAGCARCCHARRSEAVRLL
jgi:hypothetical protein